MVVFNENKTLNLRKGRAVTLSITKLKQVTARLSMSLDLLFRVFFFFYGQICIIRRFPG